MTLKVGSAEDVQNLFNRLTRDTRQIIDHVIQLTYFSRGSIQYDYILKNMCFAERQMLGDFINKRMEIESKSPHPVY